MTAPRMFFAEIDAEGNPIEWREVGAVREGFDVAGQISDMAEHGETFIALPTQPVTVDLTFDLGQINPHAVSLLYGVPCRLLVNCPTCNMRGEPAPLKPSMRGREYDRRRRARRRRNH